MSALILTAAQALDPAVAGGKAAALAALFSAGFKVPGFFVITPAAFAEGALASTAHLALAASLSALGPGPFAVRSSGRAEDGALHSHAGQFLTLLGIEAAGVPEAAAKVWESGFTQSLAAYRKSRGISSGDSAPAVIVQSMISPRAAGIAFSADPVTGDPGVVVIAAVAGLADKLAGGLEDGETYVFNTLNDTEADAPPGDRLLSPADVKAVVATARAVEAARGGPQDIEWAIAEGTVFLLQARPITGAVQPAQPGADVFAVFDNSNIIESYPGIVSPLTYSFAQYAYARVYEAFVRLLGVSAARAAAARPVFANMLERIDGRVYYNLVNWYRALALLPGYSINRGYMEGMMGLSQPLDSALAAQLSPPAGIGPLARVMDYARLLRASAGIAWQMIRLRRTIIHFHRRVDCVLALDERTIAALPLPDLAIEYRHIESGLLDRWDAPLVNDFICMIAFGVSRGLFSKWFGAAGPDLHNDSLIGQGNIVSAEPPKRIRAIAALVRGQPEMIAALRSASTEAIRQFPTLHGQVSNYLAKFGDRCTGELKLESLPLTEAPQPLFAAILAAAESDRAPAAPHGDPFARLATLCAGRPIRHRVARRLIRYARSRVRDRENLRFERTLIFGLARRVFLAMGKGFCQRGWMDHPRDVLCLTLQETLGAAEGTLPGHGLRTIIARRQLEQARSQSLPDPPERIVRGTPHSDGKLPAAPDAPHAVPHSDMRKGTGCSAGLMRGRACVISDPQSQSLTRGDILVARHTDPGWIALFANASAIVVERGSLLSHSAIVAREMGIPCVVALKGAMTWLSSGDTIEVDGAAGTVRRLNV